MRFFRLLLSLLLMLALLAGCASSDAAEDASTASPTSTPAASASGTSSSPAPEAAGETGEASILERLEAVYADLDRSELPRTESYLWYEADEAALAELPQQLVLDTPEAYQFAQIIRNYLYFGGNILEDFDASTFLYQPAAIQTALYHTAPLNTSALIEEDGSYNTDHILGLLCYREQAEGRMPSEIFSVEDVHATFAALFGEEIEVYDMDHAPYYYYQTEGIYSRVGDFGGPWWVYPMILSIEETDTGAVVEMIEVNALDKDTPTQISTEEESIDLSADNFAEATAHAPVLRYTFQSTGEDRYILVGLETIER